MTSQKKIESNRRNAQLSTGPITKEGKAISRMNAQTTGLWATIPKALKNAILSEDPEELNAWIDDSIAAESPRDLAEQACAHFIAMGYWRLGRNLALETAKLEGDLAGVEPPEPKWLSTNQPEEEAHTGGATEQDVTVTAAAAHLDYTDWHDTQTRREGADAALETMDRAANNEVRILRSIRHHQDRLDRLKKRILEPASSTEPSVENLRTAPTNAIILGVTGGAI